MIAAIVAKSSNNVIGVKNELPWHIPDDLRNFKKLTIGHSVIMGRKTYQSIVNRLGHPLPERRNIVISGSSFIADEGVLVVSSLQKAISSAKTDQDTEIFIIGGASIYNAAIQQDLVDTIYVTQIHASYKGDTYFPDLHESSWAKVAEEPHTDNEPPYSFERWERFEHAKSL